MKLVFATRNRGKLAELRELLAEVEGLELLSLDDVEVPEVVEDGESFAANAAKKALEVSRATGYPALADDSGLEVDELGGAPGIYSARYAGEPSDDERNNDKLLAALEGVPAERRTARFRSALALADCGGALGDGVLEAEGACEGVILEARRGTGGFGYDPLFYAPELGATFAESERRPPWLTEQDRADASRARRDEGIGFPPMTEEQRSDAQQMRDVATEAKAVGARRVGSKNQLSHRARAMRAMKPLLVEYFQLAIGEPNG